MKINYSKQSIDDNDIKSVEDTLRSPFLTTGPMVEKFEKALCEYVGAKYCVVVSSATAALHLVSLSLLKDEDVVLTTPNSFLATSNSILYAKAKPRFIDIAKDGNIDLDLCEEEIKKEKIKAIYAVSFSGNMLDQQRLKYLKERYEVLIIEDNSHSIGATFQGIKAGSCVSSDASVFSFHPVKNITCGEGGAITTNDEVLYKHLLRLRNHGIKKEGFDEPWKYEMRDLGFNYRLSDIHCALGISQLKRLDKFIEKRRDLALRYEKLFYDSNISPLYGFNSESAYHLQVVRVDFNKTKITKKELFFKMKNLGINLQLHYLPINKQPYYKKLGYGNEITPNMDKYYLEAFSIPLYPDLTYEIQDNISDWLLNLCK